MGDLLVRDGSLIPGISFERCDAIVVVVRSHSCLVLESPEVHVVAVNSLAWSRSIELDVPSLVVSRESVDVSDPVSGPSTTVLGNCCAVACVPHVLGFYEEGKSQQERKG